jgi:hypothetical protein
MRECRGTRSGVGLQVGLIGLLYTATANDSSSEWTGLIGSMLARSRGTSGHVRDDDETSSDDTSHNFEFKVGDQVTWDKYQVGEPGYVKMGCAGTILARGTIYSPDPDLRYCCYYLVKGHLTGLQSLQEEQALHTFHYKIGQVHVSNLKGSKKHGISATVSEISIKPRDDGEAGSEYVYHTTWAKDFKLNRDGTRDIGL